MVDADNNLRNWLIKVHRVAWGLSDDVLGKRQNVIPLSDGNRLLMYACENHKGDLGVQCYVFKRDRMVRAGWRRIIAAPQPVDWSDYTI